MNRMTSKYWKINSILISTLLSVFFLTQYATASKAPPITMLTHDSIHWQAGPSSLPPGAQFALLKGDPSNPGLFAMRLKFPANYSLPAHYHLFPENVTVISGKVYFGHGNKLDKSKSKLFKDGSFVSIPPKVNHFAWTGDDEVILQLNNKGPWDIIYVDPATDPRKSK